MVNIRDVAKRAGVAPITVSRCINKTGYCSLEAREKVETAIEELKYIPNRLASGLRSKRSNTLALILTDITNPFFTTIARGVEDTAGQAGYTVIFCNTDESLSKEKMYVQMLLEKRVDGIILVPALSTADSVNLIQKHDIPVVVLDRKVPHVEVDTVRCDSETGAYELTRLLTSLGHRSIALINGPIGVSTSRDRLSGYRRALSEMGISHQIDMEFSGAFTKESGRALTLKALSSQPNPTAIFATNNFIASGALEAIHEVGMRVPEDIALVGFDDLPASATLTVAAQPAYEMGRTATEILVKKLEGNHPEPFQEVLLSAEIVIRQSSGPKRMMVPVKK